MNISVLDPAVYNSIADFSVDSAAQFIFSAVILKTIARKKPYQPFINCNRCSRHIQLQLYDHAALRNLPSGYTGKSFQSDAVLSRLLQSCQLKPISQTLTRVAR